MSKLIENPEKLILDAARDILLKDGYSMLNMRSVAKECGIAIGTIYNYFPAKKDLVITMMSEYWEEYFNILEKLISSSNTFYVKLNNIFNELGTFIKTFREVWLKPELYATPDYVENGLKRENIYIERLIRRIESFLISEALREGSQIKLRMDSYETSKFIVMNFITVIQMPVFTYASFELFLKELLQ